MLIVDVNRRLQLVVLHVVISEMAIVSAWLSNELLEFLLLCQTQDARVEPLEEESPK